MLRRLRSILGRPVSRTPGAVQAAPDLPRPAAPTYVVGDVHGRSDLLEQMLELIDAHIGGTATADPRLVFVGDYIDHGPDSRAVLDRMRDLTGSFPDNVTCLMGNHERMLLDFIADPALRGPRWLREGAAATLESLGIPIADLHAAAPAPAWQDAAARLEDRLGPETLAWIADRPLSWASGNLWVVHAGADPTRAMADQTARVLLWGHPEFESAPRGDDAWIAHGHVIREAPVLADGRVAVDTGAWATGRLTAAAIRPDGRHSFLQT